MSKGRSNRLAGQIGEFLVCAELGRRGLIATPFSGNVPTFDVLATDEVCRTVPIQVKTSRTNNWHSDITRWMQIEFDASTGKQVYSGPLELVMPDLIWIFVVIAPSSGRDLFFVMTAADVQKVCIDTYSAWIGPLGWKRPKNPASTHCAVKVADIQKFENRWDLILDRFQVTEPDPSLT